ncbi:polyprenol phosphomannose-dependent alpha 1,6 mannosyltransferase MptB [Micromonospora sp. NPDC050417]|uniref:polyprenol phosphomannose-dependent alpha 1,6 mannosyltransferase MptB n=1 Tax=Micromonospora sp. NPDC050417 TaxID=3364280 RepID=UPI0037B1E21B
MPHPVTRLSALARCRALGVAGVLLLALGAAGTGALPSRNPIPALAALDELRRHPGPALVCASFGLALLVAAWWRLGGLVRGAQPPTPGALLVTLALWAAPLLVAPPMFSRDVYSYLAQGAMVGAGLDVYEQGPATLGGPLAAEVPAIWQHTTTPYGPVFLLLATMVAAVTGTQLALGVIGLRLVAAAGVLLLAAVLPSLARRCGVDPAAALWLGVLNPLVLIHLVGGAHNDALMVGLLGAGLAATMARYPALGTALLTLAALVKAPAVVALVFVAPLWAGQLAGRWRTPRALAGTAVVAIGTTVVVTAVAGTGYGWIAALDTPVSAANWSLSSALGRATRALLELIGADVAPHAVSFWRWAGLAVALAAGLLLWLRRDELGPVYALGLGLGALVLFGPAIRPWYLLWGLVPVAAAAAEGRLRRWAALACAGLAVIILPDGFAPGVAELGQALLGGGLAALLVLAVRHRSMLLRHLTDTYLLLHRFAAGTLLPPVPGATDHRRPAEPLPVEHDVVHRPRPAATPSPSRGTR